MRPRLAAGAAVAVSTGLLYAATARAILSWPAVAVTLLVQAAFALPGFWIARAVAGRSAGWLAPAALGPFLGLGVGSLIVLAGWAAGARGPWLLAVAPALMLLLVPVARRLQGRWHLPETEPADRTAVLVGLTLVPLLVALPFAHVGAMLDGHQAYRAYFTADFLWRRAVVAELAKGEFLPVNPFFAGDALHYYWLPHLTTAVEYRAVRGWITLDQLLLVRSLSADAFFVLFLYGLARLCGVRPWPAAGGVASAILCTSYEGAYVLADFWSRRVPLERVRELNIDAISRWTFESMPLDGLQRLLFYQPHHACGYALALMGLLAVARRARVADPAAMAVAGALLGLATLVSSFAGLMATAAAALYEGTSVLRRRDWRRGVAHGLAAAAPLAAAAGLVIALRYVDAGDGVITFVVNSIATHRFWTAATLSAGPVLALGAIAAAIAWRQRRGQFLAVGAMAAIATLCYFFVDIRDHQHVYVGWRVGHFLFILSVATTGLVIQAAVATRARAQALAALACILLPALPTTIIDVYNTQDIWNWNEGPGFRWTLLLSPEDRHLFEWLQQNTPADARVQVDPVARDTHTWAYLPAFAERRMAVGLPISMVPLAKYRQRSADIRRLYDAEPLAALDLAVRGRVDYIVVGPPEREAHPGVEVRFDSVPNLLPLVLRNASISVYEVLPKLPAVPRVP